MPIYEYVCESCGRVTEALQRLDEPPLTECGHCGGPLRKLVSAPAFQFKGSGWYVTDYARGSGAGRRSDGARTGDTAPPAAESSESKADSAPPKAAPATDKPSSKD